MTTLEEPAMSHISANDLKTKGISAIEFALSNAPEAHLARLDAM